MLEPTPVVAPPTPPTWEPAIASAASPCWGMGSRNLEASGAGAHACASIASAAAPPSPVRETKPRATWIVLFMASSCLVPVDGATSPRARPGPRREHGQVLETTGERAPPRTFVDGPGVNGCPRDSGPGRQGGQPFLDVAPMGDMFRAARA